jgi:hypothetical protein
MNGIISDATLSYLMLRERHNSNGTIVSIFIHLERKSTAVTEEEVNSSNMNEMRIRGICSQGFLANVAPLESDVAIIVQKASIS